MSSSRPNDIGEEFLQRLTWPEEDRHLFTTAAWDGSYRWFRSPNVVCIERYRRRRLTAIQVSRHEQAASEKAARSFGPRASPDTQPCGACEHAGDQAVRARKRDRDEGGCAGCWNGC